jgi:hypothetical protein
MLIGVIAEESLIPSAVVNSSIVREAAAAADVANAGFVFPTLLVDDPAAVHDTVNAFLGQIIVEAASAAATVNVGLTYAAVIAESTTSSDTANAAVPTVYVMTVAETASADAVADATVAMARNAMLAGAWPIYVNGGTSRQSSMDGPIAINL